MLTKARTSSNGSPAKAAHDLLAILLLLSLLAFFAFALIAAFLQTPAPETYMAPGLVGP